MNDKGDFIKQSINSMQRAVRSGRLTISDYYEKENKLKSAEYRGVDDGSSCLRGEYVRSEKFSINCRINS